MTQYVILKATNDLGDSTPTEWKLISNAAEGTTPEDAIESNMGEQGIYVAIAGRHWHEAALEPPDAPPALKLRRL